jgi:8-oxo-dGTP pyrophosphatase MutT (NUDIX family)
MIPHYVEYNRGYLPTPNKVEFFSSDSMSDFEKTKTVFLVPFTENEEVVLVHNKRRGFEISGGHIEQGEDFHSAVQRELKEETGCRITDIMPLGYLKMTSEGVVPPDWKYPHPIGYQQFFTGLVVDMDDYVENDGVSRRNRMK